MASVDILSAEGQKSGSVDLPAQLFEAEVSEQAIHSAVVVYQANQRQGNASAKGRSEVAYSKRKHHRQKGTGGARRGTVGSPLLRGGGAAFS
ncbi:MAG: 50S ribosomal protein L4, partial [Gemmatimonadetes bacterium]|nr:50S ribosomal protein L4 [Gemmatimonadota bacterium]